MCKKKNKGFTLTEIITTLVILGVLLLIAVPSYKAVMNNFKKDYYKKKSETILQTANTYFSDNKNSLPSELLQSKKIGLEDLVSKKYIDNINIYNSSNQCTGYVVKIKDTKDYITQVCMDCGEYKTYPTNFTACNDPTKSCDTRDYCDDAWIDEENQLEYKYPDTKTIVFVHTTNETNNDKIKKLLSTSRTITKYNKEKKILKSIDDTSVAYYPDNYQSVNLTEPSKDSYTLKYKYPTGNISMRLEVYQHSSPVLSYDNGSSNLNVSDSSTFNHYGYSNIKFQYQKENTTTWIDINGCSSLIKDHLSCSISPELPAKYRVVATTSDGVVEIGAESKLYYSLNVDLNGGSFTNFGTKYYLNKGNELNIPNPKRTSYEFTGWTLNGTGSSINNNKFTMGSKNTILTARWIENRYTLTVNPNGGSWNGTSLNTVFEGTIGTKKSIARTEGYAYPSWIGYTFAGWTLTGGGSFSASNDTYTYGIENGTLTANWTANNYTLTVNPNGGSWNGTSSSTVFEGTIGTKKSIARESGYAYPTRAGYSFTGWTRTGGGSFTSSNDTYTYGTENGTLIANWNKSDLTPPVCTWYGPVTSINNFTFDNSNISPNIKNGDVRYYKLVCSDSSGIDSYQVGPGANITLSYQIVSQESSNTGFTNIYKVTGGSIDGKWALGVFNVCDKVQNKTYDYYNNEINYSKQVRVNNTIEPPNVEIAVNDGSYNNILNSTVERGTTAFISAMIIDNDSNITSIGYSVNGGSYIYLNPAPERSGNRNSQFDNAFPSYRQYDRYYLDSIYVNKETIISIEVTYGGGKTVKKNTTIYVPPSVGIAVNDGYYNNILNSTVEKGTAAFISAMILDNGNSIESISYAINGGSDNYRNPSPEKPGNRGSSNFDIAFPSYSQYDRYYLDYTYVDAPISISIKVIYGGGKEITADTVIYVNATATDSTPPVVTLDIRKVGYTTIPSNNYSSYVNYPVYTYSSSGYQGYVILAANFSDNESGIASKMCTLEGADKIRTQNASYGNKFTTYRHVLAVGDTTITCTAKNGVGKTTSITKTVRLTGHTHNFGSNNYCKNSCNNSEPMKASAYWEKYYNSSNFSGYTWNCTAGHEHYTKATDYFYVRKCTICGKLAPDINKAEHGTPGTKSGGEATWWCPGAGVQT